MELQTENIANTMNMKDFIEKYGKSIKSKVTSALEPVYKRESKDAWDNTMLDKLSQLSRLPFPAQADTILSISKGLYKADMRSIILVGEMGTGKTLMGVGVSTLIPKKNSRIMIMCPSHLVEKWAREIRSTDRFASNVRILKKTSDVSFEPPKGREYWIISKERAKLHYKDKYSAWRRGERVVCPDCGSVIEDFAEKRCKALINRNGVELMCNAPLFSADKNSFRRYAIAEYIKRHKKHCRLDLLILDEVHELKGADTAQGAAMHALCVASKKILALTGTLMGGYASNLYPLLFRMFTRRMVAHGYRHNSLIEFSREYGVVEEIIETKARTGRSASMGKDKTTSRTAEKPGVSPLMLPHFLLENSSFLWISDISSELPSYTEEVELVEMTEVQKIIYSGFQRELTQEVQNALRRHDHRLLGALVNSLYALPDGARRGEVVYEPKDKDDADASDIVLCSAEPLDIPLLPKEARLIELVAEEKRKGRKCAIFLEHTGTRDLIPDVTQRLEDIGVKSLILRSDTVESAKREEWLKSHIKAENPDVLICNPNLVKTGLDLLDFPTIIYFQTGMSIYTLRQSSRRSWRIGQKKAVKVYFMAYADTAQERALKLIASKLETSNAVEGKLSADGLSAMSEGDSSMVIALARSIMGEDTDKRSFKDIWAGYKRSDSGVYGYQEETEMTPAQETFNATVSKTEMPQTQPSLSKLVELAASKKKSATKHGQQQISIFDLLESMEELEEKAAV